MEAFVLPVAAAMAARGHRVHLATGDRPAVSTFAEGTHVVPMNRGMSPKHDARALAFWVSYLRALQPDMVVAGTPKASLLCLVAARIARVPTRVYIIHGAVWDGAVGKRRALLESTERIAIAASTHQVAVSQSMADLVRSRGLCRRTPFVIGAGSFCGVDTERFTPTTSSPLEPPTIIFVGRLNRDKGIDTLLRVLDTVRQHVDVSLTIVGPLDETAPPDATTVSDVIHHLSVNWTGPVDDVVGHLRHASAFVLPTAREGLSQSLLEAQSAGIPVVAWRVTGVVDAVEDGVTGILISRGDENAMASAVLRLLRDAGTRQQMAIAGRTRMVENFEQRSVVVKNVAFLEGCLEEATNHG